MAQVQLVKPGLNNTKLHNHLQPCQLLMFWAESGRSSAKVKVKLVFKFCYGAFISSC